MRSNPVRWLIAGALIIVALVLILALNLSAGNSVIVVFVAIVISGLYLAFTAAKPARHPTRVRGDEGAPD